MKKNGENTDALQEEIRQLGDEVKALETITRAETADKLEKFIAVIAKEEDGAVVTTEIIE